MDVHGCPGMPPGGYQTSKIENLRFRIHPKFNYSIPDLIPNLNSSSLQASKSRSLVVDRRVENLLKNLSNIYRKSIEHLSNIYRKSIEHLWIWGVSGVYLRYIWGYLDVSGGYLGVSGVHLWWPSAAECWVTPRIVLIFDDFCQKCQKMSFFVSKCSKWL